MRNKIIIIVFFIGIAGLLLACSHENPLEKNALSLSGKFLYQASRYAEAQLNAGDTHEGVDFGKCVEGTSDFSIEYCSAIYEKIVEFARNKHGMFKDITVDDLTDANAYYQVKGYYDNQTYMGEKNE